MTRILVAHASKHGSTAEIAEAVAATLRESDLEVDCVPAGEVRSLEGYDAVVLGSAVYMRRWRGDARHLLRRERRALSGMPFWVFSSGPVGDPADDDPKWLEPARLMERAEELGVREHVVFGGRLSPEHRMARTMPPEFHDRRDWDEIRTWARAVARALAPATADR
jgi:menaquinone-dependent protoporphyrinogen oxidase